VRDLPIGHPDPKSLLRADESLVPAGGITLGGHTISFFSAVNDEDFTHSKDEKLWLRRNNRRNKRRQRWLTPTT
jgi:hypothetical protein